MNARLGDTTGGETIAFGELSASLGLMLRLAQVRLFDGFYEDLGQHGLKPGEFTVLWVIGLNPEARQGLIARKLRIKPAHMTKLVQRAVDRGLVERIIPEEDRRSVRLRLTPEGEDFVAARKPDFLTHISREHSRLTPDELGTLIAILQKFNGLEHSP
ncbi:MarR family winged helix-turn-helix transcriptional regulator [Seohaeicola zhoushanensis]|uniref:MarR family transcriptional regulator n=1 Tax=Seohaeicola zhoushanensis TaxID=1569283 RepID=A0A8J3GTV2_9RHOB|nr:MarR family transcriptional regulator [Seohaeicola zhoushanensis]GHF34004.1 MarR family transcriptional regulator [Seohaeicola zhoushanensis]